MSDIVLFQHRVAEYDVVDSMVIDKKWYDSYVDDYTTEHGFPPSLDIIWRDAEEAGIKVENDSTQPGDDRIIDVWIGQGNE